MSAPSQPTVAIVDDDPRVLESLDNLLESAGYAVRQFSSAAALLDDGCLAQIDCLIADIGMPVIDGLELRRRALAARPALPVLLITGRHEIAEQHRAAAHGHQGVFRKPFDGQALLAAVSDALRTPSEGW